MVIPMEVARSRSERFFSMRAPSMSFWNGEWGRPKRLVAMLRVDEDVLRRGMGARYAVLYSSVKQNVSNLFLYELKSVANLSTLKPLESEKVEDLMKFYGKNIIKIPQPPFYITLLKAFFIPINMYELFVLIIDFIYGMYFYCSLLLFYIIVQTLVIIFTEIEKIEKVNMLSEQFEMLKVVRILNGSSTVLTIDSRELVIGDILILESNTKLTLKLKEFSDHSLIHFTD